MPPFMRNTFPYSYHNTFFDTNQEIPLIFNAFILKKLTLTFISDILSNNALVWFNHFGGYF